MSKRQRASVVDDVPGNIQVIAEVLHDHFTAVAATNGYKAPALAGRDSRPDIVFWT